KTLPLSFLKNYGYLRESQQRGLERMTRIVRKLAAVARQRAWDRWRKLVVDSRPASHSAATASAATKTTGSALGAAVARGFMARRRVTEMRRQRHEAAARKAAHKRALLQRRLVKVLAASRTVASCLIANAAARRRERARRARAAVAKVERSYIARMARQRGWREVALYRKEHAGAGLIQRWTRGALVRRRAPLVRKETWRL
ncbi:unnamed protein product, partial [Pylaiella littoralis]